MGDLGLAPRDDLEEVFTFSTGTKARLRRFPSKRALIRVMSDDLAQALAMSMEGELKDARAAVDLEEAIVCESWVEPRVRPAGTTPDAGEVSFDDLVDAEIEETLAFAFQSAQDAATFRDDDGRAQNGAGSADVASPAEPMRGVANGKPRSVGAGRAAGKTATRSRSRARGAV